MMCYHAKLNVNQHHFTRLYNCKDALHFVDRINKDLTTTESHEQTLRKKSVLKLSLTSPVGKLT